MTARGVTFKLNTRLTDARAEAVILSPGEEIRAQTLVWTAGTAPNPLLKTLGVEVDKRGAVLTDEMLRVKGRAEPVQCFQVNRVGQTTNPNPAPAPQVQITKAAVAGYH